MSNFLKRRGLTKEDLEEIVNNSEDSEYSDENSESYASDIFCESEDESSDEVIDTNIQHGTWTTNVGTERLHFPFIGKPGLNVKIENSENPLEFFDLFITPEIADLRSRELR